MAVQLKETSDPSAVKSNLRHVSDGVTAPFENEGMFQYWENKRVVVPKSRRRRRNKTSNVAIRLVAFLAFAGLVGAFIQSLTSMH